MRSFIKIGTLTLGIAGIVLATFLVFQTKPQKYVLAEQTASSSATPTATIPPNLAAFCIDTTNPNNPQSGDTWVKVVIDFNIQKAPTNPNKLQLGNVNDSCASLVNMDFPGFSVAVSPVPTVTQTNTPEPTQTSATTVSPSLVCPKTGCDQTKINGIADCNFYVWVWKKANADGTCTSLMTAPGDCSVPAGYIFVNEAYSEPSHYWPYLCFKKGQDAPNMDTNILSPTGIMPSPSITESSTITSSPTDTPPSPTEQIISPAPTSISSHNVATPTPKLIKKNTNNIIINIFNFFTGKNSNQKEKAKVYQCTCNGNTCTKIN